MLLVEIEGGSEMDAATAIRVACSPRSWALIESNLAWRLTDCEHRRLILVGAKVYFQVDLHRRFKPDPSATFVLPQPLHPSVKESYFSETHVLFRNHGMKSTRRCDRSELLSGAISQPHQATT